jgi:hypothetical protein
MDNQMNTTRLTISMALGLFANAWSIQAASLLLPAGESYTHQFNTLPFSSTGGGPPIGFASFGWMGAVLPGVNEVRVEMFETSVAQAPLSSITVFQSVSGLQSIGTNLSALGAWQDLQGVVRISVLSGSFSISDLDFASGVPFGDHLNIYHQHLSFEVVPEPSPALLCMTAGIVVLGSFCYRRARGRLTNALPRRPSRIWATFLFLGFLLTGSASAATITAQFKSQISIASPPFRIGGWVTGYFTYDPGLPPGAQMADRPILVVEIPEASVLMEMNSYYMHVANNRAEEPDYKTFDGLVIQFTHPLLESGGGGITLRSTNLNLFTDERVLPSALPPLESFDLMRSVTFYRDGPGGDWAVVSRIEHWTVTGPDNWQAVIYGVQRSSGKISFRFGAQRSITYEVEFAETFPSTNWFILTNVPPNIEWGRAVISDSGSAASRFYRVRKVN